LPEIKQQVKLQNKVGLHARPAAVFVKTALEFKATITVEKDGKEVDAKSIISILSLGAEQNHLVTIKATGDDAENAIKKLVELVDTKFGEE
jgi:phosphocarrier protein